MPTEEQQSMRVQVRNAGTLYIGLARKVWAWTWKILASVLGALLVLSLFIPKNPGHSNRGGQIFASLLLFGLPLAGSVLSALLSVFRLSQQGTLDVDHNGLSFNHQGQSKKIAISKIVDGAVVPVKSGEQLRLRLSNGNVWSANVESVATGDRALQILGLSASQRVWQVALGGNKLGYFLGVLLGFLTVGVSGNILKYIPKSYDGPVAVMGIVSAILVGWFVSQFVKPIEIVVGSDGIALKGTFSTEFIHYSKLNAIRTEVGRNRTIDLVFQDGVVRSVKCHLDEELRKAIVQRIEQARLVGEGSAPVDLHSLDREGRSFSQWKSALRAMMQTQDNYRSATVPLGELKKTLGNPDAPVLRRIGAALALLESGDRSASEQIRVVAQNCAQPQVRVVFEQLHKGEPVNDRDLQVLEEQERNMQTG